MTDDSARRRIRDLELSVSWHAGQIMVLEAERDGLQAANDALRRELSDMRLELSEMRDARKPAWATEDRSGVIANRLYSCMTPEEALRRGLAVKSRGGECDCTMIAGHLLECGSCKMKRDA